MLQQMPVAEVYDQKVIDAFNVASEAVVAIRAIRQGKNIAPREPLKLQVKGVLPEAAKPVVRKMANISEISTVEGFEGGAGQAFMVGTLELNVPLEGMVNIAEEKAKIEAEIQRYEGFLRGVNAKLSNEKFVANAPAQVVELERKKLADATTKIENLKERLNSLK